MFARKLELATVRGDDGDRQVDPRHLEPILGHQVVRTLGVLGRELPSARPQLEPREALQRLGRRQIVAVAGLLVLALEQRTCRARVAEPDRLHQREPRPAYQPRVSGRTAISYARSAYAVASGSPTAEPRNAIISSASTRNASSSTSSASSRDARACSSAPSNPFAKRADHASRHWIAACRAGRDVASCNASSSSATARSRPSSSATRRSTSGAHDRAAVLEQLARDRPRARPFPGGAVGASGDQCPAMALADLVRRCQPQRRLGQLGRARRGAATGGDHRRIIQRGGDDGIRLVRCRARDDGRASLDRDERGDPFVHDPALRPEIVVEHRGKQWVGEPDRSALALHHLGRDCGAERIQRRRRRAPGATPTASPAPPRTRARRASHRKAVQTGADELLQHGRNQQRPERVDIVGEPASELQREEWVPARLLMYA